MPCLEISVPKLTLENKRRLAKSFTEAFVASTKMPAEIFGIRFYDYEIGETANGGSLWDSSRGKPYHHFVFYGGRLQCDVKKKLIESFSQAYTNCIGKPEWKPVIFICELPFDNIGVEGKPLSEGGLRFTDN